MILRAEVLSSLWWPLSLPPEAEGWKWWSESKDSNAASWDGAGLCCTCLQAARQAHNIPMQNETNVYSTPTIAICPSDTAI